MTEDSAGSLTISNRFQRIETTLSRIEDKLDQKASTTELDRLETRIVALETKTDPYSKQLVDQFMVSQQRLASLELKTSTIEAVGKAVESSRDNAKRLNIAIIGMVLTTLFSMAGIVLQLLRH